MMAQKLLSISLVVLLVAAVSTPAVVSAYPKSEATSTRIHVLVVFESEEAIDASIITSHGGRVTGGRSVDVVPVLFASVPRNALDAIERHPAVAYVERDRDVALISQSVPWGIDRIGARATARRVNDTAAANVTMAILDTGIDYDHVDLAENVVWGANTLGSGSIEYGKQAADDDNGHGTHVAGTVAALDNDVGVVGVAPNAQLYSIKVLYANGSGTYSDLIQGLDEALKGPDGEKGTADDADVISMSLGGSVDSRTLETAVEEASRDAVLVAAAGNRGDGDPTTNEVIYPAKYGEVIAVAATNKTNRTPTFSSEGAEVELAAPGVAIPSTYPDDHLATLSGTSMATPHVAGTVALVIATDLADGTRDRSPTEIRNLLHETAVDIEAPGRDNESGYGLVRADAAVGTNAVELALVANETTITTGGAIRFTVTRNDTGDAVNATVSIDDTSYTTGGDGEVTIGFDTAGTFTATASKAATDDTTFIDDSHTVTVERRQVTLNLTANTTSLTVGASVTFTVTRADTGARVNATLSVAGEQYQTGANGTATVRFADVGRFTVTASKDDTPTETFRNDTVTVSVARRIVSLALTANTTTIESGDAIRFIVTRNDTGDAVNATLTIDGTDYSTGEDGALSRRFDAAGTFTVVASKANTTNETFRNASVHITVEDFTRKIDPDFSGPPRDVDDDIALEDVNGDGSFDVNDITAIWVNRKRAIVQDNPSFFDYNGDGAFNVNDITALWVELRSS